ncbi:MAG TPA: helix-turn-helix domain-containing protein [Acidobacteriota bacterium]|nr:helix-turn-helix domain-containing protein [Acidobacteriota bacterium]
MDIESLLTGTKWSIVQHIAQQPLSPLELARTLGTSIANISLQLRLLEAAKIVKKQRISNSGAGKPRILYSLVQDILFVSAAGASGQTRKMLSADTQKLVALKIWQLPPTVQPPLMQFLYANSVAFSENSVSYLSSTDSTIHLGSTGKKSLTTTVSVDGKQWVISMGPIGSKQGVMLHNGVRGEVND